MATNRSTKIIGRVYRNVKSFGISHGDLTQSEILDEMNNAQDEIVGRAKLEGKANIVLETDVKEYDLVAGDDLELLDSEVKYNIRSIKGIIVPTDWTYKPLLISNQEFTDLVAENWTSEELIKNYNIPINQTNYSIAEADNVSNVDQPLVFTILNNKLNMYPIPTSDYNGDIIILYVYLSSSITAITEAVEPEIPSYWDKAIEYYTTSQFVMNKDKGIYLQLFEKEIQTKKSIAHVKRHNIERQRAW